MPTAVPHCHFLNCHAPVTHSVQRLWQLAGRAPFALQHCCDAHIPGSFDRHSLFMQRLTAAGYAVSRFYHVTRISEGD